MNNQETQAGKRFPTKLLIIGLVVLIIIVLIGGAVLMGRILNTSKGSIKPTLPPFPSVPVVPDELVIKYREGMSPANLSNAQQKKLQEELAGLGVISSKAMFEEAEAPLDRYYLINLKPGTNLEEATNAIYKLDEVEHVGPNTVYEIL